MDNGQRMTEISGITPLLPTSVSVNVLNRGDPCELPHEILSKKPRIPGLPGGDTALYYVQHVTDTTDRHTTHTYNVLRIDDAMLLHVERKILFGIFHNSDSEDTIPYFADLSCGFFLPWQQVDLYSDATYVPTNS